MSKSPRGGPRIGNTCQCRPNHLLGFVRVSIMDTKDKGMSCGFACLSCPSFVFSSLFYGGGGGRLGGCLDVQVGFVLLVPRSTIGSLAIPMAVTLFSVSNY